MQQRLRLDRHVRHDLKNFLAVGKGFSDILLMETDDSHPAIGLLKNISGGIDRFIDILDGNRSGAAQPAFSH